MDTLTRFELRKIMRKKSFYAGVAIIVTMAILMSTVLVANAQITGKDGNFLNGIPAIQLERAYNRQLAGPLTSEKLGNTIRRHQNLLHDPKNLDEKGEVTVEVNAKFDVKYEQMYSLINYAFSPVNDYDYFIDKLKPCDASVFYQKRLERVHEYLNADYAYGNYSAEAKDYFIKMNERIPVPFQMDYVTGWANVFENLQFIFLFTAFVIAVCLAPVFAGEYQSGADAILRSSRYGRSKVISAKIKASLIVSVGLLVLGLTTYTLLLLGICGFDGGNASVQMIRFMAPVPYTVFQTYLWAVLIGSLACLLVGAVTLWLSSRMRSPFPVIIAIGILLFVPMAIPVSQTSRLFNHLMALLPSNMFDSSRKITDYEVFHIFGQLIPEYKVITGFAIISIALLLPFTYRAYKKHQVA
ncbi:ABC transporter permease subunit [Paenibacillus sp. 22594]|uniref:ABC transporter permease subunit n=1 Tax=Paenibacillus sp. 22594 TaxID=3453947 RepID=UPI003F83D337